MYHQADCSFAYTSESANNDHDCIWEKGFFCRPKVTQKFFFLTLNKHAYNIFLPDSLFNEIFCWKYGFPSSHFAGEYGLWSYFSVAKKIFCFEAWMFISFFPRDAMIIKRSFFFLFLCEFILLDLSKITFNLQ